MRALVLLVLLAGCVDPDLQAMEPDPEVAPEVPQPPPPVVHVANVTLAGEGATSGTARFSHSAAGYQEFFFSTPEPVVLVGSVRIAATSPSGQEYVLVDGVHAQDENDALVDVEGCGACAFRFPYESGSWTLDFVVSGRLQMDVVIEAL